MERGKVLDISYSEMIIKYSKRYMTRVADPPPGPVALLLIYSLFTRDKNHQRASNKPYRKKGWFRRRLARIRNDQLQKFRQKFPRYANRE